MNRKALQLALREMQAATTSRVSRIGMILAIVLLSVSGPFGTFESFNVGQRFGYWAVMVVASYLTGKAAATFFLELLASQISQRWPRLIVAGLLASLPVTIVVMVVNGVASQHVDARGLNAGRELPRVPEEVRQHREHLARIAADHDGVVHVEVRVAAAVLRNQ